MDKILTTLTRERFSELLEVEAEQVEIPEFGTVWVKPASESQLSWVAAQMYDAAGKLKPDGISIQRVYQIIHQVYADPETPMFTNKDYAFLLNMPHCKIQLVINALNKHGEPVGNDEGGSNDSSED